MAWFSLVSLVVAGVLALATWHLSTGYMLDQRERSAIRQAKGNARLVTQVLERGSAGLDELLTGLVAEVESAVLLVDQGDLIVGGNSVDPTRLPTAFLDMVRNGRPAHQRTVLNGIPVQAVGLPLPAKAATYVEVSPMREMDRTFRFLSWLLIGGTLVSGLAGAVLGRWAATHSLRPLRQVTDAAAEAARGDLSVRLPATGDPDLIPLAAAFNDTAERLQQRVARDTRFAGDVSHELRSPLTTMLNAMSVLHRRSAELPAGTRQAVELLNTDLRRFRRMVDDLLEISRGDQDQDYSTFELVDLAGLVQATGPTLPESVLDIEARPWVLADRRRLERVVANLLDNAGRHGGGLVRLGVLTREDRARIEVDDAGPGVPEEAREHIFERFARGSPARREATDSGAGLGLALVTQHVRRHHGHAWVEARPGGGARFVVELPEVTD
ncbi:HAMP domain-containing histidine kinase [Actinophytocola sp. S1-96]|uniref:histidine kinase n=2 Tax=Actinophytocola gossypii TaxID=2812003 RepID=A0ABT2J8T2_9PSEU|nr:HAMP domain-containing histidine kinase [Actinophytocola gossypii]